MTEPNAPPNLLVISYFAPPDAAGVRRLASWMRWLPDSGWRPLVVACAPSRASGFDDSALADARVRATPVIRTRSLDPYRLLQPGRPSGPSAGTAGVEAGWKRAAMAAARRHLFAPDDRCGWIPFAVAGGMRAIRRHPIRAVLSTGFPNSAHSAARRIARRARLPWLADFRDGWSQNPAFFDPGNPVARWAVLRGEGLVARHADRITTVSPPVSDWLQSLRPPGAAPVETIWNGFEPDLLADDDAPCEPLEPGRWTLLYTGTFFGRRTPEPFLRALALVLREEPAWRERIRVRLRCALAPVHAALIGSLGLGDSVDVLLPVGFAQAVDEQRRADACLLVLEHGPGGGIMVSQKVFEYIAARRPILALVPEGAAAELLRGCGAAEPCLEQDPALIAPRLRDFIAQGLAGGGRICSRGDAARFRRDEQARALARILDEMAS